MPFLFGLSGGPARRVIENKHSNSHQSTTTFRVLQWARANDCPWDEGTGAAAALGGHLEVLRWAREHGCPWAAGMWWRVAMSLLLSLK